VADDLKKVTSPKAMGLDAVKSAADKFEKWDPMKNAAVPTKPLTPPPMPAAMAPPPRPRPAGRWQRPEPAPAAAPVGPATAALYEQKAARKAVAGRGFGQAEGALEAGCGRASGTGDTPGRPAAAARSPKAGRDDA
jgi:sec-independent protein translocase protein TatB